ncbi:hypothetical protein [Ectobacillus ponti]|uniref:Uncharacterized protein n=1 Tax=Ectobacillus ponti TaxID=2961894 RepID=A0AA41X3Z7_9BACI|nr:hypothetical protein [Ectobacillus ponti]MCP8968317.1 hypothetical protein [Ectobacillus ponti]
MGKSRILGALALVLLAFLLYIFSLLETFPLLLSVPFLFASIVWFVWQFASRNRFRGFRS